MLPKKIMQSLGTKKLKQPLGTKKITQPQGTEKIMQPLWTKKITRKKPKIIMNLIGWPFNPGPPGSCCPSVRHLCEKVTFGASNDTKTYLPSNLCVVVIVVTVVTIMTNFFFFITIITFLHQKKSPKNFFPLKKSKAQSLMKLNNSNCDKTQKLKLL